MTLEAWLVARPYLRPVGLLSAEVEAGAAASAADPARVPDWEDYAADFRAGVPLGRKLGPAQLKFNQTQVAES